jgi:tRNA (guanine37-N1)-methyltransferase
VRFDVVTIFPELIETFVTQGVIRRAFDPASAQVSLHCHNPRSFTSNKHQTIDDRPFGGGPGMVMLAQPLMAVLTHIRAEWVAQAREQPHVIAFSPAGKPLTHARVMQLVASPGAVLLCGRYEGIDQRLIDSCVDEELSLGDFVLSGGELGAMAVLDAVARQLPGVLHTAESAVQESFVSGLLDCPHYSRPEVLDNGSATPEVLLSGNHAHIAKWRREQSLLLTATRRPDMLAAARAAGLITPAELVWLKSRNLL